MKLRQERWQKQQERATLFDDDAGSSFFDGYKKGRGDGQERTGKAFINFAENFSRG